MKVYVDSANIDEIKNALELGLCDGVTTNPTLIAKEGGKMSEMIEKICKIVNGPVNAEVISLECEKIVAEGRDLASIAPNVVVKIPMDHDGLRAVKRLNDEGIDTTVTLIFSSSQALLASKAGATYVCPFVGRLDDISINGTDLIEEIAAIFRNYPDLESQILAASIRNPLHVINAALSGADICTIPAKVIQQMEKHPLTDKGIQQFLDDAKKFQ